MLPEASILQLDIIAPAEGLELTVQVPSVILNPLPLMPIVAPAGPEPGLSAIEGVSTVKPTLGESSSLIVILPGYGLLGVEDTEVTVKEPKRVPVLPPLLIVQLTGVIVAPGLLKDILGAGQAPKSAKAKPVPVRVTVEPTGAWLVLGAIVGVKTENGFCGASLGLTVLVTVIV